jgi:hypothetical protein
LAQGFVQAAGGEFDLWQFAVIVFLLGINFCTGKKWFSNVNGVILKIIK